MLRTIGKRLYRDRRRHAVIGTCLFLSGFLSFWPYDSSRPALLMATVAGLAFLVGIGIFAVLICVAIPSHRFACEWTAITLLLWSLLGLVAPRYSIVFGWYDGGLATFAFIIAASMLQQLFYGSWSDRLLRRRNHVYASRAWSRLSGEQLWPRVFTTPETVSLSAFPLAEVVEATWLGDGPDQRIVSRLPPGALLEEHQFIESLDPGRHVRYRWDAINATPEMECARGTYDLALTPAGRHTQVDRTRTLPSTPWRSVLIAWIDDGFGRIDDMIIAKAEKMAASGPQPPSSPASPWVRARAG